ncbi:ABC transporter permease [Anaerosporobacter sp.]|uniref:ABC transporter permease n=1 Tax=Anaerosporobacter sp. TaxID=1872529 RepID=UPI00286EE02D|nr:ABC transporter permease [Anaerosporobacter sp.]
MIRYIVKNNLKLMLRNKWVIAVMILGPILIISIISSAFGELMKSYEGVDEFKVGYRVEEDVQQGYMEQMKQAGKEAGIIFEKYPEGEIKALIENNELAGFVEMGAKSYTVYESEDYVVEGITLEYFMNQVMKEGENQALQQIVPAIQKEEIDLPVIQLTYMPAIDSNNYYGIVYIVYFIWCGIVGATNILASEKKNGIGRKYQVSGLSDISLYLGKWIPLVLAVLVETAITMIATILIFDIQWGNPLLSALIIVLSIMASTSFGFMIYNLCDNLAVTIILLFTSVWFMGFLGGSFETYMFSSTSDMLKNVSPIYHINRALVEYSCMGESTYTNSCILYMLGITVVCSVIALIADGIRKRGRA